MNYLFIDTETTNTLDDPFVYDVGLSVIDENENILAERSFAVADIFLDDSLMETAFFKEKIPAYWEEIKAGKRELRRFFTVKKVIAELCETYSIKYTVAHNALFDNRSLNTTQRLLTSSKYRYFLPYGVEWLDTLKMARQVFKTDDEYGKFCFENEYVTSKNGRRYTAEILWRYLSDNNGFAEAHTGLEDVHIEQKIFFECLRRNPEVNCHLWAHNE